MNRLVDQLVKEAPADAIILRRLAQWLEPPPYKRQTIGSIPTPATKFSSPFQLLIRQAAYIIRELKEWRRRGYPEHFIWLGVWDIGLMGRLPDFKKYWK